MNIFKTFIYYGARINSQIFDLLFKHESLPIYFNQDLEEESDDELEEEVINNYQIKAYIIDIIATLYNEDNGVLSIDNELYERLSHRRLLYNVLLQSDFARYTTNSLINIVIDYSENILPLICCEYTNWSLIYVVGDLEDLKANYNNISYNTIRSMLLKYYSEYLQSI